MHCTTLLFSVLAALLSIVSVNANAADQLQIGIKHLPEGCKSSLYKTRPGDKLAMHYTVIRWVSAMTVQASNLLAARAN